jgi:hypothetical protein
MAAYSAKKADARLKELNAAVAAARAVDGHAYILGWGMQQKA